MGPTSATTKFVKYDTLVWISSACSRSVVYRNMPCLHTSLDWADVSRSVLHRHPSRFPEGFPGSFSTVSPAALDALPLEFLHLVFDALPLFDGPSVDVMADEGPVGSNGSIFIRLVPALQKIPYSGKNRRRDRVPIIPCLHKGSWIDVYCCNLLMVR